MNIISETAFSANNRGYILTGRDENERAYTGFLEYDPLEDQWSQLSDFGRGDGNADVVFVSNGDIYGGMGVSFDGTERTEFWRYVAELP